MKLSEGEAYYAHQNQGEKISVGEFPSMSTWRTKGGEVLNQ